MSALSVQHVLSICQLCFVSCTSIDCYVFGCCNNCLQVKFFLVQLPALLVRGQANEVMLVSHDAPDAARTAQLQELVESSHASITVLVIPVELITHTDRHLPRSAVAVALQDLPTPCAVLVLPAPEPAFKAGHVSNDPLELSVHSVMDSAHSSGGVRLAEVSAKVKAAAVIAMGDCSSDPSAGLEDDEPLLAAGLTSAGAVEIVRLLEEEFDITLADTLVSPAHQCI